MYTTCTCIYGHSMYMYTTCNICTCIQVHVHYMYIHVCTLLPACTFTLNLNFIPLYAHYIVHISTEVCTCTSTCMLHMYSEARFT